MTIYYKYRCDNGKQWTTTELPYGIEKARTCKHCNNHNHKCYLEGSTEDMQEARKWYKVGIKK